MNVRQLLSLCFLTIITSTAFFQTAYADGFTLTSEDIVEGKTMARTQEYRGFGCEGGNLSPQLSWKGAPEGTEAFAVFAYDPDAPTGSGWWHWQLVNIPKSVTSLKSGAGNIDSASIPKGSRQLKNDYGEKGFGGTCPPKGHGVHRYQFTIFALKQPLSLPEDPSAALVGYLVNASSLASSTIEALYER